MELTINANKLLYLKDNNLFFLVTEFLKNLDTRNLDNLYSKIIEKEDKRELGNIFNLLTKVYYYITFLINSKCPENINYKIINYYITEEKIILKVEVEEL